jgi:hypothetical protein
MRFTFPAGGGRWAGSCFFFRIPGKLRWPRLGFAWKGFYSPVWSSVWLHPAVEADVGDRRTDGMFVGEVERIVIQEPFTYSTQHDMIRDIVRVLGVR